MFSRMFPLSPPSELRRELDQVFENATGSFDWGDLGVSRAFPAVNIWEDGESLYAEAELPGMRMEDIELYVAGNELRIKGRRGPRAGEDAVYHRQERGTGEFIRCVTLPVEVNAEEVEATLKDGVLTLIMPKAETARARKIAVKSG